MYEFSNIFIFVRLEAVICIVEECKSNDDDDSHGAYKYYRFFYDFLCIFVVSIFFLKKKKRCRTLRKTPVLILGAFTNKHKNRYINSQTRNPKARPNYLWAIQIFVPYGDQTRDTQRSSRSFNHCANHAVNFSRFNMDKFKTSIVILK